MGRCHGRSQGWRRLLGQIIQFRRLFLAHSISRAGDAFNTVALLVLIFDLTGSGVGVAGIVALEIVPILLLGPLVGLAVDRYPRRSLMMVADVARSILALLVAIGGSVPVAYGVAFGLSAFTQLFNPAASSTLPDVVESDELVEANAALWTVAVVAQTVLAPLAGLLVSTYGTGAAFCLNAASYLASAGILGGLRAGRSPAASTAFGWKAFGDGVQAARADPVLARLAGVQVLAALSAGATSALLVVLAAEHLGVGASGFGLLLAAIGFGAALGPLLLRGLIRPSDRRWLFGPYLLRAAVDVILATVPSLVAALPALVLYGVGTSTGMVAYQSTLQQHVRSELRGRVFASYDVLWSAARLVSLGLGGALADLIGIQAVYLFGGVLLLVAFAVGWMTPLRQTEQQP